MPSPADVPAAYVRAINERSRAQLDALFAPDAVLNHPSGSYVGIAAIGEMYETATFPGEPDLRVRRVLIDGSTVMVEVEARNAPGRPGATIRAIDLFELDADGRVKTLDVFYL